MIPQRYRHALMRRLRAAQVAPPQPCLGMIDSGTDHLQQTRTVPKVPCPSTQSLPSALLQTCSSARSISPGSRASHLQVVDTWMTIAVSRTTIKASSMVPGEQELEKVLRLSP